MSEFDGAAPAWPPALLAEVDRAFAVTGESTPGWPEPHPAMASPREEEYSRVTDPGKYRIIDARVDAWGRVLAARGVAELRPAVMSRWIGAVRPAAEHAEVRQLAPGRGGAMSLILATTLIDGSPFGLDIAIAGLGASPVQVDLLPACGCDACDDGSAALLQALDERVLTVARGGVLHARRGSNSATRDWAGWSGPGSWLDGSRPAERGVDRWVGEPWLS